MRVTADVHNISIGGEPSHMSLLRAIKQSNLGPGDVFIWAYGINDALYIMKAGQQTYSDTAIQTCLTMKVLFGMPLWQIESWKRHWSE